jgi:hypothetical protein
MELLNEILVIESLKLKMLLNWWYVWAAIMAVAVVATVLLCWFGNDKKH